MGLGKLQVYRDLVTLHTDVRRTVLKKVPVQYRISDSLTIENCFDRLTMCVAHLSRCRDNSEKARQINDNLINLDLLYDKIELQSLAHVISQSTATDIFLKIKGIEKQLLGLLKHFSVSRNPRVHGHRSEPC